MMSLVSTPKIRCRYTNPTNQFQIVRVAHLPYSFLERTVLPRESVDFEAFPQDKLEIHTSTVVGAILSDTIPCDRLVCVPNEARRYPRHFQQSA